MILADLASWQRYADSCPKLRQGFEFLQQSDLEKLSDGKYEIAGEDVFAIVARGIGRGQADSPLEYHRRYLDIQYIVSGIDIIGWQLTSDCKASQASFDDVQDLGFFKDRPKLWIPVSAGQFAIFYPEDAHAPLGGSGPIHKIVIKVAVPGI